MLLVAFWRKSRGDIVMCPAKLRGCKFVHAQAIWQVARPGGRHVKHARCWVCTSASHQVMPHSLAGAACLRHSLATFATRRD